MAVNSDKEFDRELPENADMLVFAKQLVGWVMFRNSAKYRSKWNPIQMLYRTYNHFTPIIETAVHFLEDTMEHDHDELFSKVKKAIFINSESYERFAKTFATEYFPEGCDAKYFLIYCVNLSVMASYFYDEGVCDAPDSATVHICQFLQEYDVSTGGWDTICRIADNHVKMIGNSANELTPPDNSLVSDGIEHQDKEQEKMSNESSYALSEEQTSLSGNVGSNIEQQKEHACSFSYTKEYQDAYGSSKRRSEKGSCSLREAESSSSSEDNSSFIFDGNKAINRAKSDEKPTPDTSNVDQELILIVSDFKEKMDLLWNDIRN